MQLKKINWWWVAVTVVLVALLLIFFRGCFKPGKVAQVKVVVIDTSEAARLRMRANAAERATEMAIAIKDSVSHELTLVQFRSRNWAAKYHEARSRKDTVLSLERCDSMANEIEVLNTTLDEYKKAYDDVMDAWRLQMNHSDSLAVLQADFVAQYRGLYFKAVDDRNTLAIQLNKANKKTKRERFLTRVVAGIAAGAIIYGAAK